MTAPHKCLQFRDVDELAFASARGKLCRAGPPTIYMAQRLGPLMELLHLSAGGKLPYPKKWLAVNSTTSFVDALGQARDSWISSVDHHVGFIRALHCANAGNKVTTFLMKAQRASRQISGLPKAISSQLVAAMQELENNIHEHSDASATGILAYKAEPGAFEFVVGDHGVGILGSLRRSTAYSDLTDEGKALETGLAEGVSRHGPNSNHGYGFRPIFVGLANLYGELRFRSGDHAMMLDGTNPVLATARISQKAPIDGFFASVRCQIQALGSST